MQFASPNNIVLNILKGVPVLKALLGQFIEAKKEARAAVVDNAAELLHKSMSLMFQIYWRE